MRQTGRSLAVLAACALLPLTAIHAEVIETHYSLAGRAVTEWSDGQAGAHPLLIFSHGFHGCATQSTFLTKALAADGWLVLAPNHQDATCNRGHGRWLDRAQESFVRPEQWSEDTYRDRAEDIRAILAAVKNDPQWRTHIDFARVALAGHSLGGYTVVGLAGGWADWKLPGIRAVLALSPYTQPFNEQHTLGGLGVPVMYQGGTRDVGITPFVRAPGGSYDQSPAPKYYVEFARAGHFAWSDLIGTDHDEIVAYSLAFLDHTVREMPASNILTAPMQNVTALRYDSELGMR